jgi:hypothetical protein
VALDPQEIQGKRVFQDRQDLQGQAAQQAFQDLMDPLDQVDQMVNQVQLAIRGLKDKVVLLDLLETVGSLVNRVLKAEVGHLDNLVHQDHRDLVVQEDHKEEPVFQGPLVHLDLLGTLVLPDLRDHWAPLDPQAMLVLLDNPDQQVRKDQLDQKDPLGNLVEVVFQVWLVDLAPRVVQGLLVLLDL